MGAATDGGHELTFAEEALELAGEIKPLLAGKRPELQSAALCDLVATWLAGHFTPDPVETNEMREGLLGAFVETIKELIPVNEAVILGDVESLRRQWENRKKRSPTA